MRVLLATMAGCLLATAAFGAQARALSQNDRHTCGWGAQIAAEAAGAQICQTVDAHDRLRHYRADLQQPIAVEAGGDQADLL